MRTIIGKASFFLWVFPFFFCQSANASPLDSLKTIFNNISKPDTTRARAMLNYASRNNDLSIEKKIAMLDSAASLAGKKDCEPLMVDILRNKVDAYRAAGDKYRTDMFKTATDFLFYCQQHKDTLNEAKAYFYRGDAYAKFDMIDKSIEEELKALPLFERTKSRWDIDYNTYLVGYYMFNNLQYKEALPYFQHAYKLWLADNAGYADLAETSGWIGNTFNALKQFDSAVYYRYKSISYEVAHDQKAGMGDGYRYLGNIYMNMGNNDSALIIYQKSLALLKEAGWMERYWLVKYFIAQTYYAKKDYHSSAKTVDEILDTAKGSKDFLSIFLASQIAGKVYNKDGQFQKSIVAYQHIIKIKDSMQKANDANQVTEMNVKMEFGQEQQQMQMQQQQQDALAERDKARQAFIRNVLIVGSIGLLFFAGIMYRNFSQKKKANILLTRQKDEIEIQKKEIQDSINYARNIQHAILPDIEDMQSPFAGMFVLYKPKDVVSGDFYWHAKMDGKIFIAAVDCTGHGVPGAFMSMIGNNKLNNIVVKDRITQPGEILAQLNMLVKEALHQNIGKGITLRDGMDIALLSFDLNGTKANVTYSGANRPLYIIRNGALEEVKSTKASIGGHTEDGKKFEEYDFQLNKEDIVYIASDGYADQFGGEKSKKFTTRHFKETLISLAREPIQKQKELLENILTKWQGNQEQIDDILVIGIKV